MIRFLKFLAIIVFINFLIFDIILSYKIYYGTGGAVIVVPNFIIISFHVILAAIILIVNFFRNVEINRNKLYKVLTLSNCLFNSFWLFYINRNHNYSIYHYLIIILYYLLNLYISLKAFNQKAPS
jgi:hypothetical protein